MTRLSTAWRRRADGLTAELAFNALGTLGLRILSGVLAFAAALLLARLLGAARYGAYAWAIAWVTVLSIAGKLGMDRLLVRDIAVYATAENWPALRGILRRSTQWVIGASLAIAAATAAIVLALGDEPAPLRDALLISLAMLPLVSLVGLYQGGLQGLRQVVLALVPDQLLRPGLFIVLVLTVWLSGGRLGAIPALLLQTSATLAGLLLTWWLFRRALPGGVRGAQPIYASRAWSTSALSMLVISAVVLIYARLDVIMLGALRGARSAGIYSSAVSAASMVLLPLGAANMALAPMVPRLYAKGRLEALRRNVTLINRAVFLVTLVGSLVLGVLAGTVLGFFGEQFKVGAPALQILLAAQVLTALASTSVMLLTMTHNEHAAAAWISAAAGLNVLLDLLFIPPWGLVGSSLATLAASALQTFALTWLAWRRLGIDSTIVGLSPSHPSLPFQGARRCAAITLACGAVGAIVGATTHPLPADRFQAEAVVAVQHRGTGGGDSPANVDAGRAAWRMFAQAIELPQVAQVAAGSVSGVEASDIPNQVHAVGDPASGILRLRARGATQTQAEELADAVALKASTLLQAATADGEGGSQPVAAFDFENETMSGWLTHSFFTVPVSRLSISHGAAHTGRLALRFTCTPSAGSGCGPGVQLAGFFDSNTTYTGRVFMRALRGSGRLRVVLGASATDVATGPFLEVDPHKGYLAMSVKWTPARPEGAAVMAIQTDRPTGLTATVDSVLVTQPASSLLSTAASAGGRLPSAGGGLAGASYPYRYLPVAGAVASPAIGAATPRWTLLGGVFGALAGLFAYGCAFAAERHRSEQTDR